MAERWQKISLIAGKEIQVALFSPLPYVVCGLFCGVCGFFFITRLVLYAEYSIGADIVGNFWFGFLAGAPYSVSSVLVFVVPLLTMRSFAEERRSGTLELLLTFPVRDVDVVLGKFIAVATFGCGLLAVVAGYAVLLAWYLPVPWATVAVGLTGLFLLILGSAACGLFFSSMTDSQIIAALASIAVLLVLWLLNWNESALRQEWLDAVREVSLFDHFEPMARGVLALDDVTYFASFTLVCLVLTLRVLESRRWRRRN